MRRVSVIFVSLKGLSFQKEQVAADKSAPAPGVTLNPHAESSPHIPALRHTRSVSGQGALGKKDDHDISTPRVLSSHDDIAPPAVRLHLLRFKESALIVLDLGGRSCDLGAHSRRP